jgi:alpha-D-xyloside xylohydrolase
MKFSEGGYRLRPGVSAVFPKRLYEWIASEDALTLTAIDQPEGVPCEGVLLTVRLSSPLPDVVRVQMWHHRAGAQTCPQGAIIFTAILNISRCNRWKRWWMY